MRRTVVLRWLQRQQAMGWDADNREIVGVKVGHRSRQSAKQLWQSLPAVYRQCTVCYTDFWEAYEQVLPSKRS